MEDSRDSLLDRGRRLIWLTKFNDAESIFAARKDTDIQFALHWAEIQVLRTLIADEGFASAYERLDAVKARASQTYQANSDSRGMLSGILSSSTDSHNANPRLHVHSQLILAEASAMTGILHLRNQSYIKGGYYVRKAWKWYESALAVALHADETVVEQSILGDIQFGVGMFHFLLSMVPKSLSWVVDIVGFKADREKAFEEFNSARDSGCGRGPAATLALVGINWFILDDEEKAQMLLTELENTYPESATLCMIRGHMCRHAGDILTAKRHFHVAMEHASELPQFQLSIGYELGDIHFFCNEYHEVIPRVERYLAESTSRNFRAYGAWKLGFCYWMTGRKADIPALYKRIPSWVRPNYSFDKWALRKSQQFLETGMFHPFEVQLLSAQNFVKARMFREALRCLNKIPAILKDDYHGHTPVTDCVGLFRLTKGMLFKSAKKYVKAQIHFNEVIKLRGHLEVEKHVVPHAHAYMAEMSLEEGDVIAAQDHLRKAREFSDYDFDKPLGVKLKRLQHRHDAKMANSAS